MKTMKLVFKTWTTSHHISVFCIDAGGGFGMSQSMYTPGPVQHQQQQNMSTFPSPMPGKRFKQLFWVWECLLNKLITRILGKKIMGINH